MSPATDQNETLRVPRAVYSSRLARLAGEDRTKAGLYAYLCMADAAAEPLSAHDIATRRDMDFETVQPMLTELYRRGFISRTGIDSTYMQYYVGELNRPDARRADDG